MPKQSNRTVFSLRVLKIDFRFSVSFPTVLIFLLRLSPLSLACLNASKARNYLTRLCEKVERNAKPFSRWQNVTERRDAEKLRERRENQLPTCARRVLQGNARGFQLQLTLGFVNEKTERPIVESFTTAAHHHVEFKHVRYWVLYNTVTSRKRNMFIH